MEYGLLSSPEIDTKRRLEWPHAMLIGPLSKVKHSDRTEDLFNPRISQILKARELFSARRTCHLMGRRVALELRIPHRLDDRIS